MARVINIVKNKEESYLYIGRGSIWGNIYTNLPNKELSPKFRSTVISVSTRKKAINFYQEWLWNNVRLRKELIKIKDEPVFGCYCKPLDCHGDVIESTIRKLNLKKIYGNKV